MVAFGIQGAVGLGLLAAITGVAADFAGGLAARRAPVARVVLLAHGLSVLLLAALVYATASPALGWRASLWGLLSGISGGVALMVFYRALASGAMGLSAALAGLLTAALPVALDWLREGRPGRWQQAGFLVAAVAIVLIAYAPSRERTPRRVLALAVLAGIGFGVQLVVLHIASEAGSVLRALTLSRAGGVLAASAVLLAGPRPARTRGSSTQWTVMLLALCAAAGLFDTLGNGLYMAAANWGRLDAAAVLSSLYPGATIVLAALVLGERSTRLQTAGMGLALIAVALISL